MCQRCVDTESVNDVLIPARHLINGVSIRQVAVDEITYYHIETRCHEIILAEGLPVESYLDVSDRRAFEDGNAIRLPDPDYMNRVREAHGCAPLVLMGTALEAVRAGLALRLNAWRNDDIQLLPI